MNVSVARFAERFSRLESQSKTYFKSTQAHNVKSIKVLCWLSINNFVVAKDY